MTFSSAPRATGIVEVNIVQGIVFVGATRHAPSIHL
jgi:hypothetical protein